MELDLELILAFSEEAQDSLLKWEEICIGLSKESEFERQKPALQDLFRIAHNLKGGSRAVGLAMYGDFIHQVEDGITLLRDNLVCLDAQILKHLLEAQGILLGWTQSVKLDPSFAPNSESFLKNYKILFEGQGNSQNSVNQDHKAEFGPSKNFTEPRPKTETSSKVSGSQETIRVASKKIDQLIQIIGELSIHQSILWHSNQKNSVNSKIYLNSLQLSQKLTKELYDQALSLRMSPLQGTFQRLERNTLELSQSLNRDVQVCFEGGDVELDRSVLEKIMDPLTHLVRNALDHGLEPAEERTAKGKNQQGSLKVKAKKDAFGIELQVSDDGRGVSAEKVKFKAIEKGLIDPQKDLSEQETYNLLFLPGFSTAEKVTDVSGRGVGMDVVKTTIENLNGSIRIDSKKDQGTTFWIQLPTAVNIIEGLQVKCGAQTYVIPVNAVEEIVKINKEQEGIKSGMFHKGDQVLPIIDLELILLGSRSNPMDFGDSLLICQKDHRQFGFLIGKVLGQHQVVVRQLNENIGGAFGVLGGTILPNGEPGLILDMNQLILKHSRHFQSQEKSA